MVNAAEAAAAPCPSDYSQSLMGGWVPSTGGDSPVANSYS
jgi:hypothetical protein